MPKRMKLLLPEEIILVLKKNTADVWLKKNIPKYNPALKPKPVLYIEKKKYQPQVSTKTYQDLQKIPGRSNAVKIQNLYYNVKEGEYHKKMRKDVLSQLFPHHSYLEKK